MMWGTFGNSCYNDYNLMDLISYVGVKKLKGFICRSATFGCLAAVAIAIHFIIGEINLFFIDWMLFIMQLGLLVFFFGIRQNHRLSLNLSRIWWNEEPKQR